jgi:hypothetical protein
MLRQLNNEAESIPTGEGKLMSESISRFFIDETDNIIDTGGRFPPCPVCQCGCREVNIEDELHNQIYLRRTVLRSQLSLLSDKMESLLEPEAHSIAQVLYWTIFVSRLDWTIGQVPVQKSIADTPDHSEPGLADLSSIMLFLDGVERLLRDLYYDCDQHLIDDTLESIRAIAFQWDRARAARSRGFLARLSQQKAVPVSPLGVAIANTPAERKG